VPQTLYWEKRDIKDQVSVVPEGDIPFMCHTTGIILMSLGTLMPVHYASFSQDQIKTSMSSNCRLSSLISLEQ